MEAKMRKSNKKDFVIKEQDSIINEQDSIVNEQDFVINEQDSIINEQDSIINEQAHETREPLSTPMINESNILTEFTSTDNKELELSEI